VVGPGRPSPGGLESFDKLHFLIAVFFHFAYKDCSNDPKTDENADEYADEE
jgi:hypothetical protein